MIKKLHSYVYPASFRVFGALLTVATLLFFTGLSCSEREMIVRSRASAVDSHAGPVLALAYTEDGKILVSGGFDSNLMIWDGLYASLKGVIQGDYDKIFDIEMIDSSTAVTANYGGLIAFWKIIPIKTEGQAKLLEKRRVHLDLVTSLAYDSEKELLVSGSWDGLVKVSKVHPSHEVLCQSREFFKKVADSEEEIDSQSPEEKQVSVNPEEKIAFAVVGVEVDAQNGNSYFARRNGQVIKIDTSDCRELKGAQGHKGVITGMTINSTRTHLAIFGEDHTVSIFNVKSMRKEALLEGHNAAVISGAFSPDGNFLATGGRDNTIILWDIKSKKKLYSIAAHTGTVSALLFHPSGKHLASGSFDRLVKVWHIAGAREKK